MGRIVKMLKNKEEDVSQATSKLSARMLQQQLKPIYPQNFEALLKVVKVLYWDRPDSGLHYWSDPELFKFIKWAGDLRSVELRCVYYDMVAALAMGSKSAHRAFELFNFNPQHQYSATRNMSWITLFFSMDRMAEQLTQTPDAEISPLGISVAN